MKKSTVKKYNIVAFLVLPITTILISILICLFLGGIIFSPDVDYDNVTAQTQSGQLWDVLAVEEGEYAYVIYSVDYDDNYLIAFQGPSIETIQDEVGECDPGSYVTSYWEGEGKSVDFTFTDEFEQYLIDAENRIQYDPELDLEVITANFSEVIVYDLSHYVGYNRETKSGMLLVTIFVVLEVAMVTGIVLAVELLVALILKLTVFRIRKKKIKSKTEGSVEPGDRAEI